MARAIVQDAINNASSYKASQKQLREIREAKRGEKD